MSKGHGKVETAIIEGIKENGIVVLCELPFLQSSVSRAASRLFNQQKISIRYIQILIKNKNKRVSVAISTDTTDNQLEELRKKYRLYGSYKRYM